VPELIAMSTFDAPVLFLVFNRPDHTARVFARIREVKPKYLFIAADGPRSTHPGDAEKCAKVRELITQGIDWECDVKTLFRDKNLGCGYGPASAISWFFNEVEEGIILEDDCLPDISFFSFCKNLLEYYRNDTRVMHIGGNNFQGKNSHRRTSYYFSSYPHIWGWATWRRSWSKYDYMLSKYNETDIIDGMKWYRFKKNEIDFWRPLFKEQAENSRDDVWDYQWTYAVWRNKGVCILPTVNLIRNIGFDNEATHTSNSSSELKGMAVGRVNQIIHPKKLFINHKADRYTFERIFLGRGTRWRRFKNQILSIPFIKKAYDVYLKK